MKIFLSFVALFLGINTMSQTYISGAAPAEPGSTENYEAHFAEMLNPYTIITWTVTGGTIIGQSTNPASGITCVVQWDTDPETAGTLSVYEDLGSQYAEITAQTGGTYVPSIYPYSEWIVYGTQPPLISILFDLQPGTVSYQWQKWNTTTLVWDNLTGYTASTYQPAVTFETVKYRCVVVADGVTYNLESLFTIPEFSSGGIVLNPSGVNYNTVPSITSSNASGGYCSSYTYTWEYSVNGGPWFTIGTSATFPSSAPPITAVTAVRRRAQCGSSELISNTILITPLYTPGDYENLNYVRTISVNKKGVQSYYEADALTIGDKFQSTTYLDGFGRSIQTVSKGISSAAGNTWKDMVQHYEYDAAGRVTKQYLPYASADNPGKFKAGAAAAQASYLQSFFGEPGTAPTYLQIDYDESPLQRTLRTTDPGAGWISKPVAVKDEFNKENEKVHIWTLAYSATALPVSSASAVYPTGTLLKKTTTDEKGFKVITYTDLSGNVILKKTQESIGAGLEHSGWVNTYYVYDDINRLRYTITDKAIKYLDANNWNLTQTLADELCYKKVYDKRGRVIIEKKPGIGPVEMVYDERDRVVFTRDAKQQVAGQWMVSLYDGLNRQVISGLINYTGDRTTLQTNVVDYKMNNYPTTNTGTPVNLILFKNNTNGDHFALSTITLDPGFETTDNGEFLAEILNGPGGPDGETTVIEGVAINKNPLPDGVGFITLAVTYHDDYEFPNAKPVNTTYTLAYNTSTPNIEATVQTSRTTGMMTGSKIRVIDENGIDGSDRFLYATTYYDEKGRAIQTLEDNYKGGLDYQVNQFDFSGKLVSSFTSHNPGSGTNTITSRHEYDQAGRLISLYKNFNNSFYKQIASYSYNELGQLKIKKLAPGYNGSQLDQLTYDYNIQGWLTGINKDYALSDNNYSQWDRYFGMYIGYDNRDNKFTASQYNGNITGVSWRSQGDNTPRKFEYIYDLLDRLTAANFAQRTKPGDASWSSSYADFTTEIIYEDGNGNLRSMAHKGIIPGESGSLLIDDLRYTYKPTGISGLMGNKLDKVDDEGELSPSLNGLLGDFKDPNEITDYDYDENGNLVKDLNKGIGTSSTAGITYNYMSKPSKIVIAGKSIIEFVYNADGEKLRKKVTYTNDNSVRITTYQGDFIYEQFIPSGGGGEGDQLQYILYEEGRLKIITPHVKSTNNDYELNAGGAGITNWPGGRQAVFEYFIKDHLGSTRMVLTEEYQKEYYMATMEKGSNNETANFEERLFGQVDANGNPTSANELQVTRKAPNEHNWPGNLTHVSRLSATTGNTVLGPNMILKVMAGDQINSNVKHYFVSNSNSGNTSDLIGNLAGSFVSSMVGGQQASALSKQQSSAIATSLDGSLPLSDFLDDHNDPSSSAPKAYLNIVFLDEQFNFIEKDNVTPGVGSNFVRVSSLDAGNAAAALTLLQTAPKNGWAFVFLSNESNEAVLFDDFIVTQNHSAISEESHYYPFGQKIAGISSQAASKLTNNYGFQGDYAEHENETGYDEFYLRMYDAQIGRWTGVDPYDEFASGYVGMGNNPANYVDVDGGSVGGWGAVIGAIVGAATPYIIDWLDKGKEYKNKGYWAAAGAFIGAGLGYATAESTWGELDGTYGAHFRAFYKGLFGGGGAVDTRFANASRYHFEGLQTQVDVPDIWGGGISLPGIKLPRIKLPGLIDWKNINIWKVIESQSWVSRTHPEKEKGDLPMNTTVGSERPDRYIAYSMMVKDVTETMQTTLPGGSDTRTSFYFNGLDMGIGGMGESAIVPSPSINTDGRLERKGYIYGASKLSLRYQYVVGSRVPPRLRVQITTERKTPMQRLRILGVPIPGVKRKPR